MSEAQDSHRSGSWKSVEEEIVSELIARDRDEHCWRSLLFISCVSDDKEALRGMNNCEH